MKPDFLGRVRWKIFDAIMVFLVAWIIFPIAAVVLLSQLGHTLPLAKDIIGKLVAGDITANFGLVAVDAVVALALVGYYLRKYGAKWSDLGLHKFSLARAIGYLLGSLVVFVVLVFAANLIVKLLFPGFNPSQEQVNDFTKASSPAAVRLSFLALVVMPPLLEEIVFRGFMFPAFSRRFGVVWGAIGSSLLFGVAHLQSNIIVYTVILGLVLCIMYRKLGSIWPGIVLHMFNNYLAFIVLVHPK